MDLSRIHEVTNEAPAGYVCIGGRGLDVDGAELNSEGDWVNETGDAKLCGKLCLADNVRPWLVSK